MHFKVDIRKFSILHACRTMFFSKIARFVAQSHPLSSRGAAAFSGTTGKENLWRQRDSVSQQQQKIRSCWCIKKWTEWRVWRESAIKLQQTSVQKNLSEPGLQVSRTLSGSSATNRFSDCWSRTAQSQWLTVTAFKIFRPRCVCVCVSGALEWLSSTILTRCVETPMLNDWFVHTSKTKDAGWRCI